MAKLRNPLEKDKLLILIVLLAFGFIIYMAALFGRAAFYVNRFNTYHSEVLASVSADSGKHTVKAYLNGTETTLDEHDWDRLFYLLKPIRNGKVQKKFPGDKTGESVKVCFSDDTILEICETVIPETQRKRDDGVCIRYTDKNGKVLLFDTDESGYEAFEALFK